MNTYQLLDSGNLKKLERIGPYIVERPCLQAIWKPFSSKKEWNKAQVSVSRMEGKTMIKGQTADSWCIHQDSCQLELKMTPFGHIGFFPEHMQVASWVQQQLKQHHKKKIKVLNLFAYSGLQTLFLAKAGAQICHVDASSGMIQWAKNNLALNNLHKAPVRWIVDDVLKFVKREINRKQTYHAIILDPPSFGRGKQGQIFKIEKDLSILMEYCAQLLDKEALFLHLSSHASGLSPRTLENILKQYWTSKIGNYQCGELEIDSLWGPNLPCSAYARWGLYP